MIGPDGAPGGKYQQQPNKILLGCVLVPVALIFVTFSLATIGVAVALAAGAGSFGKESLGAGVSAVVISLLIAAFFGVVAKRLLAALRGKPVPHLFPPVVGVVLGGVMGLACIGVAIASFAGAAKGGARGVGVGVVFLAYAVHQGRAMLRNRKRDGASA